MSSNNLGGEESKNDITENNGAASGTNKIKPISGSQGRSALVEDLQDASCSQESLESNKDRPNSGNSPYENELTEYIDENFDIDETDELWGLQSKMNNCFQLNPNKNDIQKINNKHHTNNLP